MVVEKTPRQGTPWTRTGMLRRLFVKLIRVLIVTVPLGTAVYVYLPWRVLAVAVVNRSSLCTFREALRGLENVRPVTDARQKASEASRVIEIDYGRFHLWTTPMGDFWAWEGQNVPSLVAELKLKRALDEEVMVHPGDVVLDCGANIGMFTRVALEAGAKLVVAIEPSPRNAVCLRRNLSTEIVQGRVVVCEKGVWDKVDWLVLSETPTAAEDSFLMSRSGQRRAGSVPVTTIDALVSELKLDRIDYIKMDIEGAEQRALMGARRVLRTYRPRLEISVNHLPDDPERIPDIIRKVRPDYRIKCSPCVLDGLRILPETVYFY